VLRALWPHLGKDTVLEFKSPVRDFRRNDLKRLVSYGAQYHVLEDERLPSPTDLTLVLVVPSRNEALDDEITRMGWRLTLLGGGYGRIDGGVYTVFLVITDEVSDKERDDFSGFSATTIARPPRPYGGGSSGGRRTRRCRTSRSSKRSPPRRARRPSKAHRPPGRVAALLAWRPRGSCPDPGWISSAASCCSRGSAPDPPRAPR
jgi:hypothetical protein